jgi:pyruvate/2-oxoglutarate dehydrogenase complex dihydrolipoamide acyltransferase (E2) component
MTKIRRITAENMILSKRTSAHVTTVFEIDYTAVARLRDRNKEGLPREERRETDVPAVHLPRGDPEPEGFPAGQRVD